MRDIGRQFSEACISGCNSAGKNIWIAFEGCTALQISDPIRRMFSFVFTIAGSQGIYSKIVSDPLGEGMIRILHMPYGKIGVVIISVHSPLIFH